MKRISIGLLALILLMMAGCAYYQKEVLPKDFYNAAQMEAKGLTRANHVEITKYGFRLFTIPISVPEPNDMINQTIRDNSGKGITDVQVEFSEFNIFLFSIPKMKVTGDIVK